MRRAKNPLDDDKYASNDEQIDDLKAMITQLVEECQTLINAIRLGNEETRLASATAVEDFIVNNCEED